MREPIENGEGGVVGLMAYLDPYRTLGGPPVEPFGSFSAFFTHFQLLTANPFSCMYWLLRIARNKLTKNHKNVFLNQIFAYIRAPLPIGFLFSIFTLSQTLVSSQNLNEKSEKEIKTLIFLSSLKFLIQEKFPLACPSKSNTISLI